MTDEDVSTQPTIDFSGYNFITESEEKYPKIYRFSSEYDTYGIISDLLKKQAINDHFYIVDLKKIINQYNLWKKELPLIRPYYAIKSNPDQMIMKLLSDLGCGFDCASRTEIIEALQHTSSNNLIYANPCKEITHIQFARSRDVDLMTFDSDCELYKIKLNHPKAEIILRIKVDDSSSRCKFSSKFGYDVNEVENILGLIKVLDLNLVGVSFHVGSNCTSNGYFKKAIADARKIFNIARDKYNMNLHKLDIGGGFPGYDWEQGITFSEIASEIRNSLYESFQDYIDGCFDDDKTQFQIIAEPGRFFCTQSHILVCNIIGIKKRKDSDGNPLFQYTINEGVYGSFSATVFDYAKPKIVPFNERDENKLYKSVVFGPTCDSFDKITEEAMLPELAVGDWVFIENFGAYTRASSTSFNGFQPGKVYYVMKGDI
jgi:diaminopimelate decarboxylase